MFKSQYIALRCRLIIISIDSPRSIIANKVKCIWDGWSIFIDQRAAFSNSTAYAFYSCIDDLQKNEKRLKMQLFLSGLIISPSIFTLNSLWNTPCPFLFRSDNKHTYIHTYTQTCIHLQGIGHVSVDIHVFIFWNWYL